MRLTLILATLLILGTPLGAQDPDRTEEIIKKVESVLKSESERFRAELLDVVRQELRGAPVPKSVETPRVARPAIAGNLEKAKVVANGRPAPSSTCCPELFRCQVRR